MTSKDTMQRTIDAFYAATRAMNPDAFVATFAEDGEAYDPVGTPPHRGKDALRQFFQGLCDAFEEFGLTENEVFLFENEAAIAWTAQGRAKNGCLVRFDGIDFMQMDEAGKIRSLRAYWDAASAMAQLNANTIPLPGTPLKPPFTAETARAKVQAAQDAWNSRDPERVALAYTEDSQWRNRDEFFQGREAIKAFLRRKWAKELDYRLRKELWAFTDNRISVRFEYEWHDATGQWYRSYGNEQWEFDDQGLMRRREASINDAPIQEIERRYRG